MDLNQESIRLGLGQGKGALQFHRVLGGEHHERTWQRHGIDIDRHLAFLHGFEQAGLGARRSQVDLVAQQDLAEDRPRPKFEFLLLLVVVVDAGDIAGQEVEA